MPILFWSSTAFFSSSRYCGGVAGRLWIPLVIHDTKASMAWSGTPVDQTTFLIVSNDSDSAFFMSALPQLNMWWYVSSGHSQPGHWVIPVRLPRLCITVSHPCMIFIDREKASHFWLRRALSMMSQLTIFIVDEDHLCLPLQYFLIGGAQLAN